MVLTTPTSWRALYQVNVDLGDLLGAPGVDRAEAAAAAVAAFETPVRHVGPPGSVFLMADRPVGGRPSRLVSLRESAGTFARIVPGAVPRPKDVRHVRTLTSATGAHIAFQQRLRGHDIVGGRFSMHIDAAGPYGVTGHPVGDLADRDPGAPSRRSPAAVREALREQFAVVRGRRLSVEQVLFPFKGGGVWAWRAQVPVAEPRVDLRVFLAADDLSLLLSYPASVAALFGEARVFPVSPSRTPDVIPVCLRDLGPDPSDKITGLRVDVRPGSEATPWSRRRRDFLAEPLDAMFDEAAAYFHVSSAIQYFSTLVRADVFTAPLFKPMRVVVHDEDAEDNAFFHPDAGVLTFGDFDDGARSSARSADIVFHEFGHTISHAICRLSVTPAPQGRGLGEGYSDYFACSALNDPRFGDYVAAKPNGARNCGKSRLHAAPDLEGMEEHAMGEVWAATLWGIRGRLGSGVTDALAVESLYYSQGINSIREARDALHAADLAMFPADGRRGRHANIINEEYQRRFG